MTVRMDEIVLINGNNGRMDVEMSNFNKTAQQMVLECISVTQDM